MQIFKTSRSPRALDVPERVLKNKMEPHETGLIEVLPEEYDQQSFRQASSESVC